MPHPFCIALKKCEILFLGKGYGSDHAPAAGHDIVPKPKGKNSLNLTIISQFFRVSLNYKVSYDRKRPKFIRRLRRQSRVKRLQNEGVPFLLCFARDFW